MSWRDRLRTTISFVSPKGSTFEAYWQGGTRTLEKKVGIFTYPKVAGAEVQDLDVGGTRWPLSIFFDGADHDLQGEAFFIACAEVGQWSVVHPVRGALTLQLLTFTESIDPTGSGNITKFDTEWIEPVQAGPNTSTPQLASGIFGQSATTNSTATEQFALASVFQTTFTEIAAISVTTAAVQAAVTVSLEDIYQADADINARVLGIQRSITDTVSQRTIDAEVLAGQVQQLIQLPVLALEDAPVLMIAYSALLTILLEIPVEDDSRESYNVALTVELAVSATLVAVAQIAATSITSLDTRIAAIELADTVSALFIQATDGLDAYQELFLTVDIDNQYFSQSRSFYATALIMAAATKYLLVASFDLRREKRFLLSSPRCPVEIALAEYGSPGVDDSNIDLFIVSNALKGADILLLPAGHEVLVYV